MFFVIEPFSFVDVIGDIGHSSPAVSHVVLELTLVLVVDFPISSSKTLFVITLLKIFLEKKFYEFLMNFLEIFLEFFLTKLQLFINFQCDCLLYNCVRSLCVMVVLVRWHHTTSLSAIFFHSLFNSANLQIFFRSRKERMYIMIRVVNLYPLTTISSPILKKKYQKFLINKIKIN